MNLEEKLIEEISALKEKKIALALDFDGVCKLFTEHKHQIMSICLSLNDRQLQRVPFEVYAKEYVYFKFRSKVFSGKERFLCASALADHFHSLGYDCKLDEMSRAVSELRAAGKKINAANLEPYSNLSQVASMLAWSNEVNENLERLTELGLTPGIKSNIFDPYLDKADYYIVSTATEESIRNSMLKEGIDFIKRYYAQDTCTKAEALTAMSRAGYEHVVMFGDSVEDTRASHTAAANVGSEEKVIFVPVIPGAEEESFVYGGRLVDCVMNGNIAEALQISKDRQGKFDGREAGTSRSAPINIRS